MKADNMIEKNGTICENLVTPVSDHAEVVVAGGGIAGIAAALAAARNGADVLLIEAEYALGGLATLGLITMYLPLCDGCGHQVSFGIAEELLRLSVKHGHEGVYPAAWLEGGSDEEKIKTRFRADYNGPLFCIEAERLLLEAGVRILYGTRVCRAVTDGDRITALVVENKSGRYALTVKSVIDATGDADIAERAGAETVRFGGGNLLAAWYYFIKQPGDKNKLKVLGPSDVPEDEKAKGKKVKEVLSDKRFTGLNGNELSEMVIMSHEQIYRNFTEKRIEYPEYVSTSVATIPQIRMTRRIAGRATLHKTDDKKEFPGSVGLISSWRRRGPIYEIPFDALCSDNIINLYAAGRDISADDPMWDLTRVIPACAVTGEAAGTAAAMASEYDCRSDMIDIALLRKRLSVQGVKLGIKEIL